MSRPWGKNKLHSIERGSLIVIKSMKVDFNINGFEKLSWVFTEKLLCYVSCPNPLISKTSFITMTCNMSKIESKVGR